MGNFNRKSYLMLHHLAGATIQVAYLVNYNCHPEEDGNESLYTQGDFQGSTSFVDLLCFSVLCLLCLCALLMVTCLEKTDLLALVCGV